MPTRSVLMTIFAVCIVCVAAFAADSKPSVKSVKAAPEGLSEKIAAVLDKSGHNIQTGDGDLVTVWFANLKGIPGDFEPGFYVKYPFEDGQLIGAIHVPKGSKFSDFRGQELKPGTYTLRYGQQPMDGNHIGTSETADFLLALPAKADQDPAKINMKDSLNEKSADAAGSTHPAILSLLPEAESKDAKLTHDEDNDFWIFEAGIPAEIGGKKDQKVPVKIVVVGQSAV